MASWSKHGVWAIHGVWPSQHFQGLLTILGISTVIHQGMIIPFYGKVWEFSTWEWIASCKGAEEFSLTFIWNQSASTSRSLEVGPDVSSTRSNDTSCLKVNRWSDQHEAKKKKRWIWLNADYSCWCLSTSGWVKQGVKERFLEQFLELNGFVFDAVIASVLQWHFCTICTQDQTWNSTKQLPIATHRYQKLPITTYSYS